jgi:hypothetical protein
MKQSEWERASAHLDDVMVGYQRFKSGFFRRQDWLIDGLSFDSSGFSAELFYLEAFRVPRFVPTDHLYYSFGFRIGPGWKWKRGELLPDQSIKAVRKALPKLQKGTNLQNLWKIAERWSIDLHHAELRLGVAVLNEDQHWIDDLGRLFATFSCDSDWEEIIAERSRELLATVDRGGYEAGRELLGIRRESVDELFE